VTRSHFRRPLPPLVWNEQEVEWTDEDRLPTFEDDIPRDFDVSLDIRWDTTGDGGVNMLAASWLDRATGANGGFRRGHSAEHLLARL
jgi:hypothetical protein